MHNDNRAGGGGGDTGAGGRLTELLRELRPHCICFGDLENGAELLGILITRFRGKLHL